jgi:hypothetical protein
MQINLPDEDAALVREKAAAAGFGEQIDAYVAHLIKSDDDGAPSDLSIDGKSREEIDAMIDAGFASGPSTPMTGDDWRQLHGRVTERAHADGPEES